ncbi:homeobox protein H2.0 isoform X2 [Drosophila biarmipes]|uniref:homeobox protein H2.0 isoform X2 n=1 Tax=Drosophila biarmipes TaxID=125945 RepID=UPI0007E78D2E|nr:homeobox protein H2.0 isoform X2 [Drosophila biarmipes]
MIVPHDNVPVSLRKPPYTRELLLHESASTMEQSIPKNLNPHMFRECEEDSALTNGPDPVESDPSTKEAFGSTAVAISSSPSTTSTTKVTLSFSVDRLLASEPVRYHWKNSSSASTGSCCDGGIFCFCSSPHCFSQEKLVTLKREHTQVPASTVPAPTHAYRYMGPDQVYPTLYTGYKSVIRPTPLRAASHAETNYPDLAARALLRLHQHQKEQHQHHNPHIHKISSVQFTQHQRFLGKTQQQNGDITPKSPKSAIVKQNVSPPQQGNSNTFGGNNGKRKRSWSRAVFTNLQRKGLEIQFQQQKYITKPDRRKLATRLNLTDAQVKVWFQNRRMKWRHTRENLKSGQEKQSTVPAPESSVKAFTQSEGSTHHVAIDYSSDSCSSVDLSEEPDDDDNIEINVVE